MFFATWNRDRPPTGGRFAGRGSTTDVTPIRAAAWLSAESNVSESTIRNIVDERYRMTSLRIAEALVVDALERPDLFYDGEPPTLETIARADVAAYFAAREPEPDPFELAIEELQRAFGRPSVFDSAELAYAG